MPQNNLTQEQLDKLTIELTKYAEEGASDDELREFKDAYIQQISKEADNGNFTEGSVEQPGQPTEPLKKPIVNVDRFGVPETDEYLSGAREAADKKLKETEELLISADIPDLPKHVINYPSYNVEQLDSAITDIDSRLEQTNFYLSTRGLTQPERKFYKEEREKINEERSAAIVYKAEKTNDYDLSGDARRAVIDIGPSSPLGKKLRPEVYKLENRISEDIFKEVESRGVEFYSLTEEDYNGVRRADAEKVGVLADEIAESIAKGNPGVRQVAYERIFERAENEEEIKMNEEKIKSDPEIQDVFSRYKSEGLDEFESTNKDGIKYKAEYTSAANAINKSVEFKLNKLTTDYNSDVNSYKQDLISQIKQGVITPEEAEKQLGDYNKQLYSDLQNTENLIIQNNNLNLQELTTEYSKKIEGGFKEFLQNNPMDPDDLQKLNDAVKRIGEEVDKDRFGKLKDQEMMSIYKYGATALIPLFGKSLWSTLGRSVSGAGTFNNIPWMVELGDEMNTAYSVADERVEDWSDLANIPSVTKSIGRLAGSALPSILVGTAVSASTGGLGTIPAMALVAGTGWMTESIDMAGNIKRDVIRETGSLLKGEQAAGAMWEAQLGNWWTYVFDGLPYVGKALRAVPSRAARIAISGTESALTETPQETFQTSQEQQIMQTVFDETEITAKGFSDRINQKLVKETFLEVAPGSFALGGGGRAVTEFMMDRQADKLVKEMVAKTRAGLVDDNESFIRQKIFASMNQFGKNFTNSWLSTLQKNGSITEEDLNRLYTYSKTAEGFLRNVNGLNLTEEQNNTYFALSHRANELYNQAESITDDKVTRSTITEQANALKKNAQEFLNNPETGGSFVSVQIGKGPALIMNEEQAIEFVTNNPYVAFPEAGINIQGRNVDEFTKMFSEMVEGTKAGLADVKSIDEYSNQQREEGRLSSVDNTLTKINNAEYINDNEIDSSIDQIFDEIDRVDGLDISDNAKESIKQQLFSVAEILDNHEFRTKTETRKVTPKESAEGGAETKREIPKKSTSKAELAGVGTVSVTFTGGNTISITPQGQKGRAARVTKFTFPENFLYTNEQGDFTALIIEDAEGNEITINDPEIGVPLAINNIIAETAAVPTDVVEEFVTEEINYIKERKEAAPESREAAPKTSTQVAPTQVAPTTTEVVTEEAPVEESTTEGVESSEGLTEEAESELRKLMGLDKSKRKASREGNTEKDNQRLDKVERAVDLLEKSLSKVMPNIFIAVAESSEQFALFAEEEGYKKRDLSQGIFRKMPVPDSKTFEEEWVIILNPDSADVATVFHEGLHAVLRASGLSETQARAVTGRMIDAVKKTATKKLQRELKGFTDMYPTPQQNEEYIAELIGILANNYNEQNSETKSLIRRWLEKLAEILGLKPKGAPLSSVGLGKTDAATVNMLNVLAEKMSRGKVLSKEDVTSLRMGGPLTVQQVAADMRMDEEILTPGSQILGGTGIRKSKQAKVEDFDTTPPKVDGVKMIYPEKTSIDDVLEKSGGAGIFINSDGTKVGVVVVNGRKLILQGGIDYTFIEQNVKDGIGFAASEDKKISQLKTTASDLVAERDRKNPEHKGKPIAVFVASQNGETMLGEWYAAEYIMEGLDASIVNKKYNGGLKQAEKDFVEAIKSAKVGKTEDGLRDKKSKDALLKMVEDGKFKTHEGRLDIAKKLASKDFSFGFRVNLNKDLLSNKESASKTGKNVNFKKSLAESGYFLNDFWNRFIDERFLKGIQQQRLQNEKGKTVSNKTFSGFFYDPSESLESQINHAKLGVDHAQFNSSFKSQGNFLLDSAYDVNKLFPLMGYPEQKGIDIYNEANNTKFVKEAPKRNPLGLVRATIVDKGMISKWLKENGYSKLIVNPYTSIALSLYTGVSEAKEPVIIKQKREEAIPSVEKLMEEAGGTNDYAYVTDNIRKQRRTKPAPKKTIKAYKLFRVDKKKPGQLFPLFVKANEEVLTDVWYDAEVGDLTPDGKVKSKIGNLAYRPGWHMGDAPIATHIGEKYNFDKKSTDKSLKKPTARNANHVWAEVEVSADVNWQTEANKRASKTKEGKIIPRTAHITDQIPEDGYYRYKTNPNMTGNWIIGGAIKVNRVLTDQEVKDINDKAGVADLPRVEPIDLSEYGFEEPTIRKQKRRTERLAPNGKRSNLDDVQYDTVRTPAFKNWFGDWENDPKNASKVVDDNGEPLVVYHGTTVEFDVFDKKKLGSKNWYADAAQQGFFFASKKETADEYTGISIYQGTDIDNAGIYKRAEAKFKEEREKLTLNEKEAIDKTMSDIKAKATEVIRNKNPELANVLPDGDMAIEIANTLYKDGRFSSESINKKIEKSLLDSGVKNRKNKLKESEKSFIQKEAKDLLGISPQVKELYLNIREISSQTIDDANAEIAKDIIDAKGNKLDGVVFKGEGEVKGDDIYVAFEPNQIKLADGSNKTFDPDAPSIRKQKKKKPKSKIKDAFEYGIQKGIPAINIKNWLIKLGYTEEEVDSGAYDAERIWNKDGKKVKNWFEYARRSALSARKFRPQSMFLAQEAMESAISAELRQAKMMAESLNSAINRYKSQDKRDELIDAVDEFMRDAEERDFWRDELPDEIAQIAEAMRIHIDSLSLKLVEVGAIKAESSRENILKNIGVYMNRSFEIFDNKNWKKEVGDQVITAAQNHLREVYYNSLSGINELDQQLKDDKITESDYNRRKKRILANKASVKKIMDRDGVTEDEALTMHVEKVVDDILTRKDVDEYISFAQSVVGKKDLSSLKRRKDIPPAIRALMGEYTDPGYNYAMSIFKIANLVENQKYLTKIRDAGLGVWLFEDEAGIKKREGYKQITFDGDASMNPLDGLYAPEAVADAFNDKELSTIISGIPVIGTTYKNYLKLVGGVKYSKTILSFGTHAKNVIGNMYFMAQNGYLDPREYQQPFMVLAKQFAGKELTAEQEAKMDEWIRAGIIGQGASIGEIKSIFEGEGSFEKALSKRIGKKTDNMLSEGKKGVKWVGKKAQEAYQYEDDMFKIVAYEKEKLNYSKILFDGKSYNQLDASQKSAVNDYVAEIIKNILPNYGRIGGFGKFLKAVPVSGTFISFQLEAYRTAYNTVGLAMQEIKGDIPGISEAGKKLAQKRGAKRLASIVGFQAFKYGMIALLGIPLIPGDDDDEDGLLERIRMLLPFWDTNSDIAIQDVKPNGNFTYISVSASDPYGSIFKVVNATTNYAKTGEGFSEIFEELTGPFISEDILLNTLMNIKSNENDYGGKIVRNTDTLFEASGKIALQLYKTFEPGSLTSTRKIAQSENKLNEVIGQFTGFKLHEIKSLEQAGFKFREIQNEAQESKKAYNSVKYNIDDYETQEEINKVIRASKKAMDKDYKEAVKLYQALISLGVSKRDIRAKMDDAGISSTMRSQIARNSIDVKLNAIKK